MAKCTEIDVAIAELVMAHATDPAVTGFDDVVNRMVRDIPGLSRAQIADSVFRHSIRNRDRVKSELAQRMQKVMHAAKEEGKVMREIGRIADELETGMFTGPAKQQRKAASDALAALRKTRTRMQREADMLSNVLRKESDIDRGEVEPAKKQKRVTTSPAIEELAKRQETVNKKIAVVRQIQDLERQIRANAFDPKKPKASIFDVDPELDALRAKRDLVRYDANKRIESLAPRGPLTTLADAVGGFRSIMSTGDLSAVGLQGWWSMVTHPKIGMKQLAKSIRAIANRENAVRYHNAIVNDPMYRVFKEVGGYIAPVEGGAIDEKEEAFSSSLVERIPVLGRYLIKPFERQFVTFLNGLRFEIFKTLMRNNPRGDMSDTNAREAYLTEAKTYADLVNIATGRGSLGKYGSSAPFLNLIFFSVRNWASRLQLLAGKPFFHGGVTSNWRARRVVAKEYAKFMLGTGMLIALAKLAGAEWEDEPTSKGFGKIRFGDTTLDLSAQLGAELSFLARGLTGQETDQEGDVDKASHQIAESKVRSKLSPVASLVMERLDRKEYGEKDFQWIRAIGKRVTPLPFQDLKEVSEHINRSLPEMAAIIFASTLGFRPKIDDVKPSAIEKRIDSRMNRIQNLGKSLEKRLERK